MFYLKLTITILVFISLEIKSDQSKTYYIKNNNFLLKLQNRINLTNIDNQLTSRLKFYSIRMHPLIQKIRKLPSIYRILKLKQKNHPLKKLHIPPFIVPPVIKHPIHPTSKNQPILVKLQGLRAQFPPVLEFILQKIQRYFSVYVYEDLSRPPVWDHPPIYEPFPNLEDVNVTGILPNISDPIILNIDNQYPTNITIIGNNATILNEIKNITLESVESMTSNVSVSTIVSLGSNTQNIEPNLVEEISNQPKPEPSVVHAMGEKLNIIAYISNGKMEANNISVIKTEP